MISFLDKEQLLAWFLPHVSKFPDVKSPLRGSSLSPQSYLELCPQLPLAVQGGQVAGEAWDKWLDRVHAACAVAVAVRWLLLCHCLIWLVSPHTQKNNACLSFIIFCLKREESPGREQDPKSPGPGIPPFSLSILNRKHSC